MTMTPRSVLLAAALLSIPAAGALAQNAAGPVGSYSGSQPSTADTTTSAQSGINATSMSATGGTNPTKPGATGRTVVPGSNSSVANDSPNTAEAKANGQGGASNGR